MSKKIIVSIIIVNYKSEDFLIDCISSIYANTSKISFEIIVVDNEGVKALKQRLHKTFPKVLYIKSPHNNGYGAGNNLGATYAQGEYLFFLNPDTRVQKNCIAFLLKFLNKKNVGAVAPLLLNKEERPYEKQGAKPLTLYEGLMTFSLFGRILGHSNFYSWNKKSDIHVGVIPGTAFMIRKMVFDQCGKFDENYFLYFEESDLSMRLKSKGLDLYMISQAQIIHFWGESTQRSSFDLDSLFAKSRDYYFRKHYGLLQSWIIHIASFIDKYVVLLLITILLGLFLRTFKLNETMMFIGDFGWFYLSAKDMILTHTIPLVGITASRTWLHQGPLWTYFLALALKIYQFNPLAGGYIAALFGTAAILAIFITARKLFSKNIAIIACALYASSPLIVIFERMPYHTAPISFFSILLIYAFYKWLRGAIIYFPITFILLAILYNLELATIPLLFVVILYCIIGAFQKKKFITQIKKKDIAICLIGVSIMMLPILLYDIHHGYAQTLKFAAWFPYRLLTSQSAAGSIQETIMFFDRSLSRMIFPLSDFLALIIFLFGFVTLYLKRKDLTDSRTFLLIVTCVVLISFFINKTPSDAYLPMMFPIVILIYAFIFGTLFKTRIMQIILFVGVIVIVSVNIRFLLDTNFLMGKKGIYGPLFSERIKASQKIVSLSKGEKYNLVAQGVMSKFPTFIDNYRYLTWYYGNQPSKDKQKLQIMLYESPEGIIIK